MPDDAARTTPDQEWRAGQFGSVVLRKTVSTEIWASRGASTTTLFIDEPGKPSLVFTMPNAMAERLGAVLKGDKVDG